MARRADARRVLYSSCCLAASNPPVDPSLPYSLPPSHGLVTEFPRVCVLARTRAGPRMERTLPAFLSSLLAAAWPALDVFLVDTEFVGGDGVSTRSALAAAGARALDAAGVWGAGARVRVPALAATDADVADPLVAASGWTSRPDVGGVHAKTARWTRAWVATDVVMNRLLQCGGRIDEACAWDNGGGVGNVSSSACDYVLVTNTDNLYPREFFRRCGHRGSRRCGRARAPRSGGRTSASGVTSSASLMSLITRRTAA